MDKILNFLEDKVDCRCYQSYKYCYDNYDVPSNDFDDHIKISVKKSGENSKHKQSINLKPLAKEINQNTTPLFKYFLDGSRRAYKIDNVAINERMFSIIAGQIGIGCCERLNPDKFKSFYIHNDLVLSLPDIVDKDSKNELFYNILFSKLNDINLN